MSSIKQSNQSKPVLATILGNIFEGYDFVIFGFMLIYMKHLFLPDIDPTTQYILGFLLFSVGYLGRPLGAYVLGSIGNTLGRKQSILVSIGVLTASTFLIGMLPNYHQVGLVAPLVLVLLRLTQNFAVSIEQVGGTIYLVESYPRTQRYTMSSAIFGSIYVGNALGLGVCLLLSVVFSSEQITNWAWRLPFLISLPMGLVAAWFRLRLAESQEFLEKGSSVKTKVTWYQAIRATGLFVSLAASAYLAVIYIPNFVMMSGFVSKQFAFSYSMIANILVFALAWSIGVLCDKGVLCGEKMLEKTLWANFIFAIPVYAMLGWGSVWVVVAQAIASLILAAQAGVIFGAIFDTFTFNDRFPVLNLGFNFAMTFFGGLAPFIAAYLAETVHALAPAFYLMVLSSTSLIFFAWSRRQVIGAKWHHGYI